LIFTTDDIMADALKDVPFKTVQVDALVRRNFASSPRPRPRHRVLCAFTREMVPRIYQTDHNV
jgi:hypothetical protein